MEIKERVEACVKGVFDNLDEDQERELQEILGDQDHDIQQLPDAEQLALLQKKHAPGMGHFWEAMDRAFVIQETWEYVRTHPAVVLNKNVFLMAELAGQFMFEVYQELGRVEYDNTPEEPQALIGKTRNELVEMLVKIGDLVDTAEDPGVIQDIQKLLGQEPH